MPLKSVTIHLTVTNNKGPPITDRIVTKYPVSPSLFFNKHKTYRVIYLGIKYSLRHYIIYRDYRHVARLRVAMSTLN